MSVFLDTSVLLAGLVDFGPQSAPAQSLLHAVAEKGVPAPATAWHCCLEFFSVATRLPPEFRITPSDAAALLQEEVFAPAMGQPRGLPRLRALFENWLRRVSQEIHSGCIYISGAVEFDDRSGPVRDALVAMIEDWRAALDRAIRQAIAEGHLRADTDPNQCLFELHGLVLAVHHDARLLRHPGALEHARLGFERLLGRALPSSKE